MNDLVILCMMLDGPQYGYQLKRQAGWILGQEAMHNNLVYPLLRRFLEKKWVSKKAVPGNRGQTRQQYALTREGRRTLFERLNRFNDADARSEHAFHLRVGLFPALGAESRKSILDLRQSYLERRDQRLAVLEDSIDLRKFGSEVVGHLRKQIALERDWVERLRRMEKTIER